ncbi:ergosterol biosynthesis protein [Microbotryomycetes sp. JL201]|nr:ergosterol biosynthesis protein [Microbotryomycetes sp. JL201]
MHARSHEPASPSDNIQIRSLAVFNAVQNFTTVKLTRKVYSNAPGQGALYDLALISYVLALGHFALEFVVYRTAGLGPGLLSPLVVASTSLFWMWTQYDNYVTSL